MAKATGVDQFLARFGDKSILCNPYTLTKLGVDRANCFLKIDDYTILCVPFQFGFKRSLFIASLSKQELTFFQKYVNNIVGLSIAFLPKGGKGAPSKFFIRSTLSTIGPMKGKDNVGLFALDFKATPEELVTTFGTFLDGQDRIKMQYEDYGKSSIKITAETAKLMGYNQYATITDAPGQEPKRIQVFNLSSKTIEFLEAAGSPMRPEGTQVSFQLFFQKYRVQTTGAIVSANTLPQGLVHTVSSLSFSPELVEVIDDYWFNSRNPTAQKKPVA